MIWLSLPLHQHSLPLCTYHASSSNRWHFPNILCCLIFCALHILDDSSVLLASWTCLFFIFCGSSDNYLHETPHSSLPSLLSIILYIFAIFFVSISFISALMFMISFLPLTLGFVCFSFFSCFRYKNRLFGAFPGGAVVESLPANAGDTGLSPGLGRSHMPQSSWAREPQILSLCVWSLCSAQERLR